MLMSPQKCSPTTALGQTLKNCLGDMGTEPCPTLYTVTKAGTPVTGWGQVANQARETRKNVHYLLHFRFEYSRTGEKIRWSRSAETWLESQLSPMSDLGLVTSSLRARLPYL